MLTECGLESAGLARCCSFNTGPCVCQASTLPSELLPQVSQVMFETFTILRRSNLESFKNEFYAFKAGLVVICENFRLLFFLFLPSFPPSGMVDDFLPLL